MVYDMSLSDFQLSHNDIFTCLKESSIAPTLFCVVYLKLSVMREGHMGASTTL